MAGKTKGIVKGVTIDELCLYAYQECKVGNHEKCGCRAVGENTANLVD